jgi:hypothetical protein
MPRRLTDAEHELRAKVAALKAAQIAARKSQANDERPLRLARATLSRATTGHLSQVHKYSDKLASVIHQNAMFGGLYTMKLRNTEETLRRSEGNFKAALVNLQLFDGLHRVDPGAPYPKLPVIDRAAIEAQAHADREVAMQTMRERYAPRQLRSTASGTGNPSCTL